MKNNHFQLKKDLNLIDENFTIKKGTLVNISNVFDEKDSDLPTIISLKFENISGNYNVKKIEFDKYLKENSLVEIKKSRFQIGNCVMIDGNKRGVVKSFFYDKMLKEYIYGVLLSNNKSIGVLEESLDSC